MGGRVGPVDPARQHRDGRTARRQGPAVGGLVDAEGRPGHYGGPLPRHVCGDLTGHADANTVKLLVHALRGGGGDPRGLRFGTSRDGHGPLENGHSPVAAPAKSPV